MRLRNRLGRFFGHFPGRFLGDSRLRWRLLLRGLSRASRFPGFFRPVKLSYVTHQLRGNISILLLLLFFIRHRGYGRGRRFGRRKTERLQFNCQFRFTGLRQGNFRNRRRCVHYFINRMLAPVFILL